jgi:exopolysaccharide biosynthesis protein
LALSLSSSRAATVLGPWVPIFKGIDYTTGTNHPGGGGFNQDQVIYGMRVDLTDPDIQFYTSPRYSGWVSNYTETQGYTMTNFLKNHSLQVAVNANQFYTLSGGLPSYTATEGTTFNVSGLLISQGIVSSGQSSSEDSSCLLFATNKTPTFIPTNWPARSTTGFYTAVAGTYPVLTNGINLGYAVSNSASIHALQPRTAMGLSQDRRYFFILVIDGRQSSGDYSDGAYDWQTAAWLKMLGAWDGINLDGGGSSCLVMADSTGKPVQLNRDVASLANGRERTVAAQFGIYAKPVPGFFTNVNVLSDDTAATITWETLSAASTSLKYGLATSLGLTTASNAALTTNHAVLLTNLTSGTGYYFAPLAAIGTNLSYIGDTNYFVTSNYITTVDLFDFTNLWKYTTANLDGISWTAVSYDDSGWDGSGPGLLWLDYINGANVNIPETLMTQLPADPNSEGAEYPYTTYYFRSQFVFSNTPSSATLQFQAYIDDGAILYLNGREIYRLRMTASPASILNSTLSSGYPCSGNATCMDSFSVSGSVIATNLVVGTNVLAVEVHNYSTGSPDITFGLAATATAPYVPRPALSLAKTNTALTVQWNRGGYILQQSGSLTGAWSNVPGPVIVSPYQTTNTGSNRFFRLRK